MGLGLGRRRAFRRQMEFGVGKYSLAFGVTDEYVLKSGLGGINQL